MLQSSIFIVQSVVDNLLYCHLTVIIAKIVVLYLHLGSILLFLCPSVHFVSSFIQFLLSYNDTLFNHAFTCQLLNQHAGNQYENISVRG